MTAGARGEHVARAWFIGANPWLGYETPVTASRERSLSPRPRYFLRYALRSAEWMADASEMSR